MATIFNQIHTEEIDTMTGEIIRKKETVAFRVGEEPPYIKVYLQDVLYLSDLPPTLSTLTYEFLKRATYAGDGDGMTITFSPYIKKKIATALKYKTIQAINNAIAKLTKGHILYRLGASTYQFNPHLFGKGNWADVQHIRMNINYDDIRGKTFGTAIKYKGDDNESDKRADTESTQD